MSQDDDPADLRGIPSGDDLAEGLFRSSFQRSSAEKFWERLGGMEFSTQRVIIEDFENAVENGEIIVGTASDPKTQLCFGYLEKSSDRRPVVLVPLLFYMQENHGSYPDSSIVNLLVPILRMVKINRSFDYKPPNTGRINDHFTIKTEKIADKFTETNGVIDVTERRPTEDELVVVKDSAVTIRTLHFEKTLPSDSEIYKNIFRVDQPKVTVPDEAEVVFRNQYLGDSPSAIKVVFKGDEHYVYEVMGEMVIYKDKNESYIALNFSREQFAIRMSNELFEKIKEEIESKNNPTDEVQYEDIAPKIIDIIWAKFANDLEGDETVEMINYYMRQTIKIAESYLLESKDN